MQGVAGLVEELEAKRNDLDQQLAEHLKQKIPDPAVTAHLARAYREAELQTQGAKAYLTSIGR
jgi:hypothetical protein